MQFTHLGPYEIEKPIGKGGMGSVYAAIDRESRQRVAIKALTPHLAMAEGFRERFEAEIESLKTLRHDGIVRLYGYGEQDGVLFYSMELVEGVSLEDELRNGRRFNWREVTGIAVQLALALKHAHDHGIVHRDIKPANILLFGDDRVKLADFGIARLFGTTQLTTAGGVLGTADYMSPEQAEGRPVTARCDQYSLGGVMYALLAGRPPFIAKNLPQMLQLQRFAKPEPIRRYAPETPEQLDGLVLQLLAKDPAERFPNMQVLARHLQAMARALSRPAADDFSLEGESLDRNELLTSHSLAVEVTQPESPPNTDEPRQPVAALPLSRSAEDAPTLAADEFVPSVNLPPPATVAASAGDARPTRFTTIEQEEARQRSEQQRSWIVIAAQLLALVSVVGGMVALGAYLSQPPSADELYESILQQVEQDESGLTSVGRDIDDFLERYAEDPRAPRLVRYKERLELDKLERKLQREARRSSADASLSPAEQLYVHALGKSTDAPDEAVGMLQSLVDLYGPRANEHDDGAIVQLARRRLATLRSDLTDEQARVLSSLRERMETAHDIGQSSPDEAARIYSAIIRLYGDQPWAAEMVERARQALAELK